ncbi:hypothetical protein BH11MYX4_BH11MYX4_46920 [soil metagenome]
MAAVLLLVGAACWPRSRGAQSAAELAPGAASARATARAETTAAKLISAPGTAKLVVAAADQADLNN